MPNQDLTPLLRDRWSPRVFDPSHELSDEQLRLLLEAARWAPSCGNSQPWAFLVGLRDDPTHKEICRHLSRGNSGWVPRASAVLVTACQTGPAVMADGAYASYDLGQSVAHLTVQAAALGLVVHQFAGFDHPALAEAFDVPADWQVTSGVAIGVLGDPAQSDVPEREHSDRKPLTSLVFAGTWGEEAVL